jgi:beta-glucosidase
MPAQIWRYRTPYDSIAELPTKELILVMLCMFVLTATHAQQALSLGEQAARPWMDTRLSADERASLVVRQMTLDEKIAMVHGAGWNHNIWVNDSATPTPTEMAPGAAGFLPGVKRFGIPPIQMADAAVGVTRGAATGRYSTPLPSGLAEASAWSQALSHDYGALIGRELLNAGFNMSLGGGCNLAREPRNGRNFEYKGEDPILSGTLTGAAVRGLQEQGVIGDIKHLALNDQETKRNTLNAVLDMRSMRETDLLAFEIAIRDGHPGGVMCAYNRVNGVNACENAYLLNEFLKMDLGFEGFVLSDWRATHSVQAALAGLDVEMPDGLGFDAKLKDAVLGGQVPASRLDDMVHRVLRTEFAAGVVDHSPKPQVTDIFAGFELAQRVAEQGSVLLKNDHQMLPLNVSKIKSIVLIGGHADVGVLSGGGSAQVDPPGGNAVPGPVHRATVYDPSSPLKVMRQMLPGIDIRYVSGENLKEAAEAAQKADVAVVFSVQPAREDTDLVDLSLPGAQDILIRAIATANTRTSVILETGGPVEMPWLARVPSVLEIWYPGIRGAEALTNLLVGKVNPSGKLPITFPASEQELPRPKLTALSEVSPTVNYEEGLKVGYKWYDAEGKSPLFPFGYGLSYTKFSYSDLHANADPLSVSFVLKNCGNSAGTEISEVYVSLPPNASEPPKRLIGWKRTALRPGESKQVSISLNPFFLSVFDVALDKWKTVAGTYKIEVGGSSANTPVGASIFLGAR